MTTLRLSTWAAGAATAAAAVLVAAATAAPSTAAPAPPTPPARLLSTSAPVAPCAPAATTSVLVPHAAPVVDWSENLAYDADGDLWVTRSLTSRLERYDPAGDLTATVDIPSPSAVRLGPDGMLYVNSGDSPVALATGSRDGRILRLDPAHPQAPPEVFASGFGMPNGLAFGPDGALYVGDSARGVIRVRPDGSIDDGWSSRAPRLGDGTGLVNGAEFNGVQVIGDAVYVAITESLSGRILRIPIDAPDDAGVAADITVGPGVPALPDDLTAGSDGRLYVATTAGKLVRVDPDTGGSCVIAAGQPMTAVAPIPGAAGDLAVTTELGDVLRVHVPG